MRQGVIDFADSMENKLSRNDDDKGPAGWLDPECKVDRLIAMLKDEVEELEEGFEDCNPAEVQAECVDVANFAMMIYNRITERDR